MVTTVERDIRKDAIVDPERIFKSDHKIGQISETEVVVRGEKYILCYDICNRGSLEARISILPFQKNRVLSPYRVRNGIELWENELAARELDFFPGGVNFIYVSSNSGTRLHCEGRGLGTALILLSDLVIEDVLTRHCRRFEGNEVIASIIDASHPNALDGSIPREGWASAMAQALGYERVIGSIGPPIFQKVFRVSTCKLPTWRVG